MILAAIPWLNISINLLLGLFVLDCLGITLLVLMQRPKQEGLGAAFGGGVTDQVFGARTTNVLQRGTVYLGSIFFILALALSVLISYRAKGTSMAAHPAKPKAEITAPAAPATPPADQPKPKSLSEELPPSPAAPDSAPADASPAPVPAPAPADAPKPEEKPAGQ